MSKHFNDLTFAVLFHIRQCRSTIFCIYLLDFKQDIMYFQIQYCKGIAFIPFNILKNIDFLTIKIDMLCFFNFHSRFSPKDLDNNGLSDVSLEETAVTEILKKIYQAEFVH